MNTKESFEIGMDLSLLEKVHNYLYWETSMSKQEIAFIDGWNYTVDVIKQRK